MRRSEGTAVHNGETISTGPDEGLSLLLARSESLRIDASTEIRIVRSDQLGQLHSPEICQRPFTRYLPGRLVLAAFVLLHLVSGNSPAPFHWVSPRVSRSGCFRFSMSRGYIIVRSTMITFPPFPAQSRCLQYSFSCCRSWRVPPWPPRRHAVALASLYC